MTSSAHRVIDHRRHGAQGGEGEEVQQRLKALGDHDADRIARPHAVGPVPLGVAVAQLGQVGQAVPAQNHLAPVVGRVAVHHRHAAVRVRADGVLQEVAGAEVGLDHELLADL